MAGCCARAASGQAAALPRSERPREPRYAADKKEIETAAAALRRKLVFVDVADDRDLESPFATAVRQHVGVPIPHSDPFFNTHRSALTQFSRIALNTGLQLTG
jgi:hypothetical protein